MRSRSRAAAALVALILALILGGAAAPAQAQWARVCPDGGPVCRLEAVSDGAPAAVLAVQPGPAGGVVGEVVLPLGVHLPDGVTLRIDGRPSDAAAELLTCVASGCLAAFVLEGPVWDAAQSAERLEIGYRLSAGGRIAHGFGLSGLVEALGSLSGP